MVCGHALERVLHEAVCVLIVCTVAGSFCWPLHRASSNSTPAPTKPSSSALAANTTSLLTYFTSSMLGWLGASAGTAASALLSILAHSISMVFVRAHALALPIHHTTVVLPCNYACIVACSCAAACNRPPIGAYICTGGNLLVGGVISRYHVESGEVIGL